MPAALYIDTHGGTGIGGSDDHAGVDIGRTWTETPPASTPEEFLRTFARARRAPDGDQGSAAKWAHTALALATARAPGGRLEAGRAAQLTPAHVMHLAQRVVGRRRGARRRRDG